MHHDVFNVEGGLKNPRSSHSLSVVDDQKIRKDLFVASSNLLKKIRKLEKDHSDFLRWDQFLYQDWYNLTFREELLAGEKLEHRHKTLKTFHVHLQHVASTSKVSAQRAYNMLKEEEMQYQAGDDVWRFVIDKLRRNRFETATTPKASSSAGSPKVVAQEEPAVNFADIFYKDDSALSGLKRKARSVYHYLNDIDDGMMARHMSVPLAGYQLFKETFQIAMKCGDWKLLVRIWKTADVAYQQRFTRNMPFHLREFLQHIIADNTQEEELESEQEAAEKALRSIYRKLARFLHPDTLPADTTAAHQEWASMKWQRVQKAYKDQDQQALQRIELLCRAELGQLNDLTTDEIYQSSLVLNEEFEALKKSLKESRLHPAWKFSTRRNFEPLKKKALQEITARFAPIKSEIEALEDLIKNISKMQN